MYASADVPSRGRSRYSPECSRTSRAVRTQSCRFCVLFSSRGNNLSLHSSSSQSCSSSSQPSTNSPRQPSVRPPLTMLLPPRPSLQRRIARVRPRLHLQPQPRRPRARPRRRPRPRAKRIQRQLRRRRARIRIIRAEHMPRRRMLQSAPISLPAHPIRSAAHAPRSSRPPAAP